MSINLDPEQIAAWDAAELPEAEKSKLRAEIRSAPDAARVLANHRWADLREARLQQAKQTVAGYDNVEFLREELERVTGKWCVATARLREAMESREYYAIQSGDRKLEAERWKFAFFCACGTAVASALAALAGVLVR